jgi:hypothetical protein
MQIFKEILKFKLIHSYGEPDPILETKRIIIIMTTTIIITTAMRAVTIVTGIPEFLFCTKYSGMHFIGNFSVYKDLIRQVLIIIIPFPDVDLGRVTHTVSLKLIHLETGFSSH